MKALILFMSFVMSPWGDIFACDCRPPSVPAAFRDATTVFVGRCVSGRVIDQGKGRFLQYEFEVTRSWKGVNGKVLVIITGMSEANCGRKHFDLNEPFLVYAHDSAAAPFTTFCDRGGPASAAADEIKELNALAGAPAK